MGRKKNTPQRKNNKLSPSKKRAKPGTVALEEIKRYQDSTNLIIPRLSFQRVVREIAEELNPGIRFTKDAMDAFQTGAEAHLVEYFQMMQLCAIHGKRVTIMPTDLKLLQNIFLIKNN